MHPLTSATGLEPNDILRFILDDPYGQAKAGDEVTVREVRNGFIVLKESRVDGYHPSKFAWVRRPGSALQETDRRNEIFQLKMDGLRGQLNAIQAFRRILTEHRIERASGQVEMLRPEDVEALMQKLAAVLPTTPALAEAQDEGALSVLDRLLNYSGARGSFDAMKHGDAVKDAEELLRSVKSPSHTDLMVTPESIDAYMKVNPMEAQDEGAAGELKPCPFCGGEAEIIHLDDGDNAGGSCVCCTKCQASGNVEFGRKENFVENWNRRAHPSPTPAADADRVRIAVEALERGIKRCETYEHIRIGGRSETAKKAGTLRNTMSDMNEALAALKSEGK